MEEVVRAFNYVTKKGWAMSEWSVQEIEEAYHVADKLNMIPPIAEQCQHYMFHRQRSEGEYVPIYAKYGIDTTVWSALAKLGCKLNHLARMGRKQPSTGTVIVGAFCPEQVVDNLKALEVIPKLMLEIMDKILENKPEPEMIMAQPPLYCTFKAMYRFVQERSGVDY
ncbi:hypothetical protein ACEPAH_1261 [Sanghuangporus vaninii]